MECLQVPLPYMILDGFSPALIRREYDDEYIVRSYREMQRLTGG